MVLLHIAPPRRLNAIPLSPISGSMAAGPLIERSCAENAQNDFGGVIAPIPQTEKPDF